MILLSLFLFGLHIYFPFCDLLCLLLALCHFLMTFPQVVSAPLFCHAHFHLFPVAIKPPVSNLLISPQFIYSPIVTLSSTPSLVLLGGSSSCFVVTAATSAYLFCFFNKPLCFNLSSLYLFAFFFSLSLIQIVTPQMQQHF